MLKKIWKNKWILRSLLQTIYFNFHYLPYKQAIKLPILLYKPKLLKCKGKIIIEGNIKTGMIQLGKYNVSLYPNSGIVYENHGGTIVFKGSCNIGNNSFISIGSKGYISFGNRFSSSTSLKITSYHYISFLDSVRVGWDCMFLDTDFHSMKKLKGGYTKGFGPIIIGNRVWFGSKCIILKNTVLPNFTTVSAGTVLNKKMEIPEYSVIGLDNNITVKCTGLYRDLFDDKINYKQYEL